MPSKPWLENACPTQNYNITHGRAAACTSFGSDFDGRGRESVVIPARPRLAVGLASCTRRRNSQGLETINALHQVPPGPVASGRHTACGDGSHYCVSAERWRR